LLFAADLCAAAGPTNERRRCADHRGKLRHWINSSSFAFCVCSAAAVSLFCLDCRASRSAGMPGSFVTDVSGRSTEMSSGRKP
jgi:hypothetical protein